MHIVLLSCTLVFLFSTVYNINSFIDFSIYKALFKIYSIIYKLFPLWDDSKTLWMGIKLTMFFILKQPEAYRKHCSNCTISRIRQAETSIVIYRREKEKAGSSGRKLGKLMKCKTGSLRDLSLFNT